MVISRQHTGFNHHALSLTHDSYMLERANSSSLGLVFLSCTIARRSPKMKYTSYKIDLPENCMDRDSESRAVREHVLTRKSYLQIKHTKLRCKLLHLTFTVCKLR